MKKLIIAILSLICLSLTLTVCGREISDEAAESIATSTENILGRFFLKDDTHGTCTIVTSTGDSFIYETMNGAGRTWSGEKSTIQERVFCSINTILWRCC